MSDSLGARLARAVAMMAVIVVGFLVLDEALALVALAVTALWLAVSSVAVVGAWVARRTSR